MIRAKKPVVKKRKVKKSKTPKSITKKGKGNVSQVVNVFVNKQTRQRRASAPRQIQPQIQPQMYNAGQNYIIQGLAQQNKTLMDILDKQRKADTTPNTDIQSLDELVKNKKQMRTQAQQIQPEMRTQAQQIQPEMRTQAQQTQEQQTQEQQTQPNIFTLDDIVSMRNKKSTPSSSGESTYDTIFEDDEGFTIKEKTKRKKALDNIVIDTGNRENISNMLSSIAEGMEEIQGGDMIRQRILQIGDQLRPQAQEPQGIRVRIAEIDELDEINKLENDFYSLRTQLQEQKRFDDTIKMSDYRILPKKVNTLRVKVAQMRNKLNQSQRLTADEV